jgi:SAM-dependent methyltransferase
VRLAVGALGGWLGESEPAVRTAGNMARVGARHDPYYQHDLALVHHRGFGFHAAACSPGVLKLLEPVLARKGLVLEIGCGSGLLTRHLVRAGLQVIATDASPAMLEIARDYLGAEAPELRPLALPDDPLPQVDAVVGIGHPLSYLPDAAAIERALTAIAGALRPEGVLALDVCDLSWGAARREAVGQGRVGPDWAIITELSIPSPERFVRDMTTFLPNGDGSWRRAFERHENTLIDTARVPERLATLGISAEIRCAFGQETLPEGLHVVIGTREP